MGAEKKITKKIQNEYNAKYRYNMIVRNLFLFKFPDSDIRLANGTL